MSKADVWMPLYIGDYLRDTRRLTLEQHGAYLLLLMEYWVSGPLPDDDMQLARIVGCSEHAWSIIRASLEHYFEVSNGHWTQHRADEEREKASDMRKRRKSKASAAAEARWSKVKNAKGNAPCDASSIASRNPPSPSPSQPHIDDDDVDDAGAEKSLGDIVDRIARAGGINADPSRSIYAQFMNQVVAWQAIGATTEEMIEVARRRCAEHHEPIQSFKFLDAAMRQAVARRENNHGTAPSHSAGQPRTQRRDRAAEMDQAYHDLGFGAAGMG